MVESPYIIRQKRLHDDVSARTSLSHPNLNMEHYSQHDPWPMEEIYSPNISTTEFEEEYEEEMEYVRYPVLNKPKKEHHRHQHHHQRKHNETETVSTMVEKSDDDSRPIDASPSPETIKPTGEQHKGRKVAENNQEEEANTSDDNNCEENDSETIVVGAPPKYRSGPIRGTRKAPVNKSKKADWEIRQERRNLKLQDLKYIMEMFGGPSRRIQARTKGPRPRPQRTPTPPGFYGMFSSPHFSPAPTDTEPSTGPGYDRNVSNKLQEEEAEVGYYEEEEAVTVAEQQEEYESSGEEENDEDDDDDDYEPSGKEEEEENRPSIAANANAKTTPSPDPELDDQYKLIARTLNFMVRARTHGIDVSDFESLSSVSREQWRELAANSVPDNNDTENAENNGGESRGGEDEDKDEDEDEDEVARNASHVAQVLISNTSPRTLRRLARHATLFIEELEVLGVEI
jgi:hypothetical protein